MIQRLCAILILFIATACTESPRIIPQNTVTCGTGTTLVSGACTVSADICGANTKLENGKCVATATTGTVTCDTGTALVDGKCVVSATACGIETTFSNGKCIGKVVADPTSCGQGTVLQGSSCVPSASACGANTQFQNGKCEALPAGTTVTCGPNTVLSNNKCVVAGSACGTDTQISGSQCVSTVQKITCGTNTTLSGNTCTAASSSTITCGSGTTLSGNQCVPANSQPTDVETFLNQTTNNAYVQIKFRLYPGDSSDFEMTFALSSASLNQTKAYVETASNVIGNANMLYSNIYLDLVNQSVVPTNSTFDTYLPIGTPRSIGLRAGGTTFGTTNNALFYGAWSQAAVTQKATSAAAGNITFERVTATTIKITLTTQMGPAALIEKEIGTFPFVLSSN